MSSELHLDSVPNLIPDGTQVKASLEMSTHWELSRSDPEKEECYEHFYDYKHSLCGDCSGYNYIKDELR